MKIILLRDVAKLGKKNEIVNVHDGLAMNKLLPKGDAKPATPENLKAILHIQAGKSAVAGAEETRFFATKSELKDKTIDVNGLKNDNGHLFAALKTEQIVLSAKEAGVEINQQWIKIVNPIKTTGTHLVGLEYGKHKAEFSVDVK